MPKVHQLPPFAATHKASALRVGQRHTAIVNLRGNSQDPAFLQAVQQALAQTALIHHLMLLQFQSVAGVGQVFSAL